MNNNRRETVPTLSVVMPVYEVEDFCVEAFRTLWGAGRNYADQWELILVDDHSKDQSMVLLKKEISRAPDLRCQIVELSQNVGQGMARVRGVDVASGEFLWFVDSDDAFEVDAFKTILENLGGLKRTEFLYSTQFARIDTNGNPLRPVNYRGVSGESPVDTARGLLSGRISTMMWDKVFRLSEIQPHLSKSREREDAKSIAALISSGAVAKPIQTGLVTYRVRKGSTTNQQTYAEVVSRSREDKAVEVETLRKAYGHLIDREIKEFWSRNNITDSLAVLKNSPKNWRKAKAIFGWKDLFLQLQSNGRMRLVFLAAAFRLFPAFFAALLKHRGSK